MIKELSLNRAEIEESLKKTLYNNIMATYLLLSRTGGPYNNHIPEVYNLIPLDPFSNQNSTATKQKKSYSIAKTYLLKSKLATTKENFFHFNFKLFFLKDFLSKNLRVKRDTVEDSLLNRKYDEILATYLLLSNTVVRPTEVN